ncbi:ParB/RepB/Spo0J family partition protein [Caldicellulosiruptor morganii]|uniref:ParB/RepB/Spo0J family partition protein n=1 Tax=Caldicellulosiruptor morganii TaxID=1387555 RepID=A0ABY7BP68_9FIRM|nr:ParB/RepB/Spo0J family partition protein [Caldicellulosiruptor morganii]WAM33336.1 ParB/RepB/Spo0J family partition protein [Caldicellulosiruptor morganii]
MSYEKTEKIINVSDIQEFPTWLGSKCLLLSQFGLDPYRNTDEELLEVLEMTAKDPKYLDICLKLSRCKGFYEKFLKNETPFFDQDPIVVREYNGKFWVIEGKHRVCLAKRAGFEKIKAVVYQLREDTLSRIPDIGNPGVFRFSYKCKIDEAGRREHRGELGAQWLKTVTNYFWAIDTAQPFLLNSKHDTDGKFVELVEGVKVKVSVNIKKTKRLFSKPSKTIEIESEVAIEENHKKTRIWLLSVHFCTTQFCSQKPVFTTLFRTGLWRKQHEMVLEERCICEI